MGGLLSACLFSEKKSSNLCLTGSPSSFEWWVRIWLKCRKWWQLSIYVESESIHQLFVRLVTSLGLGGTENFDLEIEKRWFDRPVSIATAEAYNSARLINMSSPFVELQRATWVGLTMQSLKFRLLINDENIDVDGDKLRFILRSPSTINSILEYSGCYYIPQCHRKGFCRSRVAVRWSIKKAYQNIPGFQANFKLSRFILENYTFQLW